tara:strand:- start:228 stop:866 length:639 start_codon:yes stop_codon:yes gene_type:complete
MNKEEVKKALEELKKQPKRKFTQSYDLILNLKNINVKSNPVDFNVNLPNSNGKKIKVGAFVEPLMVEQAEKSCDLVIKETDFDKYKDKKVSKKLAQDYDYFISQATLMPKVAAAFGRVLGTRGKMPNPKLGCVIPPNANIEQLMKKLAATVSLSAKKATNLQCMIGKEDQPDEEIVSNIMAVYQAALKNLPNESQNVKDVCLKLTMGKPVKV